MGAALGCCSGPAAGACGAPWAASDRETHARGADDFDANTLKMAARYHPLLGRCDAVEKSLLRKMQRSLSSSWAQRSGRAGGRHPGGGLELHGLSPRRLSLTGSRYGLDEPYESDSDMEPAGRESSASATSGSRLLCDFYNLVLECDHSKFYMDANGRRVKGAYLHQIEILEDYFDAFRRTTVGSRRRRRSSVDEIAMLAYQPPSKLKNLGPSYYDRSSTMSLMSNDTSQTMGSDSDYWATFMDTDSGVDYAATFMETTFPPRYPQPLGTGTSRTQRDSIDRRRSWVFNDMQIYGSSVGDSSMTFKTSPLLLFSPVNTSAETTATAVTTRQRSLSRGSFRAAASPTAKPAMLSEGICSNLWGQEEVPQGPKSPGVLPTFASAALTERRRASLTLGSSSSVSQSSSRRISLHTIAPVAAS